MIDNGSYSAPAGHKRAGSTIILQGQGLTINDVVQAARFGTKVKLTDDKDILQRVEASYNYIVQAAREAKPIYGVTTGFGGMANTIISPEDAAELQENLIRPPIIR